jgi:protein farnesyltransferase subunit beta
LVESEFNEIEDLLIRHSKKFMVDKGFSLFSVAVDDEGHSTETISEERKVEQHILEAKRDSAVLDREGLVRYCERLLSLSPSGMAQENFSPWNPFYVLLPFRLVGYDKRDAFAGLQRRLLSFFANRRCRGMFSGFPDESLHLVVSYSALCGLCLLGLNEGYALIDRQALYRELLACKLPNGAFATSVGMEHDQRSTFCAVLHAYILNMMTPELVANVADFVLSCRSYDGGLGPRPLLEAHGGYLHCGVGIMKMLGRLDDLNLNELMRWIALRQTAFSGGFCGRPNKLVDSCYSWWVGSAARMIADHLGIPPFWNEPAMATFLLQVAQCENGGFYPRPPGSRDPFHTLYAIAGLGVVGGKETGDPALVLPDIDPLVPCPVELVQRMRTYFLERPFTPE